MTTLVDVPGIGEIEFPDSMSEAEISTAIQGLLGGDGNGASLGPLIDLGTRPQTRLPDGGVSIALRGPSVEEIQRQNLGVEDPSVGQAATRGFSRQILDNMLAVPEVVANAATRALTPREGRFGPLEAISGGFNFMTGGAVDPAAASERVRTSMAQGQPVVDFPSAAEVSAGTDVALQLPGAALRGEELQPGQRFDEALERQQATDIRFREDAPISTTVGEVGGDIATIAATRGLGRGAVTGSLVPARAQTAVAPIAQTAETMLGRAIQATGRTLLKAGGRAAETGAEAAFLASLQGADPAEVGAMAAGAQALGDVTRPTFLRLMKPKNLFTAIGLATITSLGIQQLTPGGLDRILPTLETKNKEAVIAILLGATAGGLTGRISPGFGGAAFAELASTIPRGVLISTLTAINKDPARVLPVLAAFSEDPTQFGPKAERLLTRALTVEGASLEATVESLFDDREFRRQFKNLAATVSGT